MEFPGEGLRSPLGIYALQTPAEMCNQMFSRLLSYVSVDKHERIMKFRRKEDAIRTLLADIMIRNIIMDRYKLTNKEIIYTYNAYGKPCLAFDQKISFNVSHSGTWILAIVGKEQHVGIDVEEIRPIDMDIAKRFYTPDEYADLQSMGEEDRLKYFYELWTSKESFLKALGCGLSTPMNSFAIRKKGDLGHYIVSQSHSPHVYFLRNYDIDSAYKLTACATTDEFPDSIEFCELSDLISLFL